MSKSLERTLFYICLVLGAIALACLTFGAKADTVSCPDNAPVNKEALARVKQHDADIAVAHSRVQPKEADLKASIERLKKYPGDLKEVGKYCSVKKVVK